MSDLHLTREKCIGRDSWTTNVSYLHAHDPSWEGILMQSNQTAKTNFQNSPVAGTGI